MAAPASANNIESLVRRYPEVQLATLAREPPEGDGWLHEIKFDGYRLLGFLCDGALQLHTRNGKDWTESFPSLIAAFPKLKARSAVVDMEAVILEGNGKTSFQALQAALGRGGDRGSIVAFAFDLLHLDGEDLTPQPLTERKQRLERLLASSRNCTALRYSGHVMGQGRQMFSKSCEAGLEGIVSKEADSPYVPGRGASWLKIKCGLRQEFIIVGYSDARSGDRALGALYLGYRKDGGLHYAGKVGTGFSMTSARDLADTFARVAANRPVLTRAETVGVPAGEWQVIHWLRPVLVCEVQFTEWTSDGRIRHPSFQGLRSDKKAMEVRQEVPGKKAQLENLVLKGIAITHPGRVISEIGHITKGELAEYYAGVAELILPNIVNRPLSLLRCPAGIGDKCFFQRNPGKGLGADVHPFEFHHKGKKYEYLYIDDEKGLLELVQMGAIELHPWGSPVTAIDCPDRMIFDLDPSPELPFEALKLAAQDLRKRLRLKGLESVLKCTGGKGLHITVPLDGKQGWPAVKSFAGSVAAEMVSAVPEAYVATMTKAKRTGKIFIDFFRNDYTATAIADYGVRARDGAPVAVPLNWTELKSLKSASQFTMKDVLKRGKSKAPKYPPPQTLPVLPSVSG
jgi:bifunctional non-homologous end joining protein LigD